MGSSNSTFTFDNRENISMYRIRIQDEIIWSGICQEDFHNQYQFAFDKYTSGLNGVLYNALSGPGMLILERFYGDPILESDKVYNKGPTRSCDTYMIEIRKCQNGKELCNISACTVVNTQLKEFKFCSARRFPNMKKAVAKTIKYLNSKNF